MYYNDSTSTCRLLDKHLSFFFRRQAGFRSLWFITVGHLVTGFLRLRCHSSSSALLISATTQSRISLSKYRCSRNQFYSGYSYWSLCSPAAHIFAFENFTCWSVWQTASEREFKGNRYQIFFLPPPFDEIPLDYACHKQARVCCHTAKPRPWKTFAKLFTTGVNIYNFVSKRRMFCVIPYTRVEQHISVAFEEKTIFQLYHEVKKLGNLKLKSWSVKTVHKTISHHVPTCDSLTCIVSFFWIHRRQIF